MEARNGTGKRAKWGSLYQGDRPRDILNLTEDEEATLAGMFGFTLNDQDDNEAKQVFLRYDSATAITLTNYADTPIGTVIIAPKLTTPTIFVHKAQSSPGVVGDWYKIEGVQVT